MVLTKAEKYIQSRANIDFPSQELWIKDNMYFWSFDKEKMVMVQGIYERGNIVFCTELYETDTELISEMDRNRQDGYKCFASLLFT